MDVSSFLEALEQSLLVADPSVASAAEESQEDTSAPLVRVFRSIQEAKVACVNSLWHEFGVALLKLFDANHKHNRPGVVPSVAFDILHNSGSTSGYTCEPALDFHTYVLVPTRFSISTSIYARLVKDILDTVAVAATEGNDKQRMELLSRGGVFDTLIEGALSNLSAGKAADVGVEGDEDGIRALKCLQAQALLLAYVILQEQDPENTPVLLSSARSIIADIAAHLQTTKAQDIDPTLQAFLGRARLYESEAVRDFQAFYQHATKYVELSQRAEIRLATAELAGIGFKSSIAGLASDSIHTQGELLNCQEMVSATESDPDNKWILDVVRITHEGDLDRLNEFLADANRKSLLESILPASASTSAIDLLIRKVQRIALVRSFCRRIDSPAATGDDGHRMTFEEIANECRCSASDGGVERLVLSAVAHGLITAKVDGLTEEVRVSWVVPRVLALHEVDAVQQSVLAWTQRVGEAAKLLLNKQLTAAI